LTPEELIPYQWLMPRTKKSASWNKRPVTLDPLCTHADRGTASLEPELHIGAELGPDVPHAQLNWTTLFGNSNPVEIEIGMGKGLFLLNSSIAHPDINYFGIEIVRKYQLYATTRFALRKLTNVKTVCADARWVLRRFVEPASVTAAHVYFPDPWWKARHKKRRVFTSGFALDVARVIRPGGRLRIASDVEEYFGVMTGIIKGMTAFRETSSETSTAPLEEAGYQTNFERKARQKGTPVWRAEFERTTDTVPNPDLQTPEL
jgi:tRNA (guanine-N7-)-methyltransferase